MAKYFALPIATTPYTIGIYRTDGDVTRKVSELAPAAILGWSSQSMNFTLSPDGNTLFVGTTNAGNVAVVASGRFEREGDTFVHKGQIVAGETAVSYIFNAFTIWSGDGKTCITAYRSATASVTPYVRGIKKQADGSWAFMTITAMPNAVGFGGINYDGSRFILSLASVNTGIRVYHVVDNAATVAYSPVTASSYPLAAVVAPNENYAYLPRAVGGSPVLDRINLDNGTQTVITLTIPADVSISARTDIVVTSTAIFCGLQYPSTLTRNTNFSILYWPLTALASPAQTIGPFTTAIPNALTRIGRMGFSDSLYALVNSGVPNRVWFLDWQAGAQQGVLIRNQIVVPTSQSPATIWGTQDVVEPSLQLYNNKLDNLINHGSNVIKLMLLDAAFTFRPGDETLTAALAGATEISGNGWPAGGPTVTGIAVEEISGATRLRANSTGANISGGSITGYKALIYDDTNDIPLAYIDFGGAKTALDGERLSLEFNTSGIVAFVPA